MRVLALAAATEMGSNTRSEFLLQILAIEPEVSTSSPKPTAVHVPEHDVDYVIDSYSDDCGDAAKIEQQGRVAAPMLIAATDLNIGSRQADIACRRLEGLVIPRPPLQRADKLRTRSSQAEAPQERAGTVSLRDHPARDGSHAGVESGQRSTTFGDAAIFDKAKLRIFRGGLRHASEDGCSAPIRVSRRGQPSACKGGRDVGRYGTSNAYVGRCPASGFEGSDINVDRRYRLRPRTAPGLAAMADRVALDYSLCTVPEPGTARC